MIRGTTPQYVLTLANVDLTGMTVYVTIRDSSVKITKTGYELTVVSQPTGSTIAFSLSQQETLSLHEGAAAVQVRFIDASGIARATKIASLPVNRVLLEKVIEYADTD